MRKITFGLVLGAVLLLFGFIGASEIQQEIPRATPPGFPEVGMLAQHMNEGIGSFVEIEPVWDKQGDIIRCYFNQNHVQHDKEKKIITVWFLEEYLPRGRDYFIADLKSKNENVEALRDFKYKYYQISFAYADEWGKPYEYALEYGFAILAGGEVCDSKMKIITLMDAVPFQKLIYTNYFTYYYLSQEVQKRYLLKY